MRHMKLQGKILAAILGTMTLVLALLIGYVAFQANRSTMKSAQDTVAGMALATANAIDAEVEVPLDTARAMVMAIEALDREAPGARNQVLSVLENVLAETPMALSTWIVFEPDAFDGKDGSFASRDGYKEKGRFVATFLKTGGQTKRTYDITEAMLASETDGAWYLGPLRSGEETIAEPYSYNYTGTAGDDKFITSLSIPIHRDGKVVGVAGIGIDLASIQELASKVRIMETGFATLYSNTGIYVYHQESQRIGKSLAEEGKGKIAGLN